MALIRFGGGIADARGSIEGQVFSKNRYGNYIRNRTTPVNPSSSRQQTVRAQLQQMVEYWQSTLTDAQRAAWNLYGASVSVTNKLGEAIYLSGFNWFCGNNVAILQAGGSIVAAGPTTFNRPGADGTFAATASEATQNLSITFDTGLDWVGEDDAYLLVSMSQPRNNGRSYVQGPFRVAGAIAGDSGTPPTSPQTIACPFAIAEDQIITVRARIVRADGRTSAPFQDTLSASA